jgi:D-glycero-alpha-D-manno-heptose 1-phosphate guanylyltransferase
MENCNNKTNISINDCSMVILAGGLGTRIKHLIGEIPKPMFPVLGKPFLEWLIRFYAGQGIRRFIISTGYMAEKIEQYFSSLSILNTTIVCVREESPLGTAGGFVNAVSKCGFFSPAWFVANGDSVCVTKIQEMIDVHQLLNCDASILGVQSGEAARFGSMKCDNDGQLIQFAEKRPGVGIINAGLYLFKYDLIKNFPQTRPLGFENDVFPILLEARSPIIVVNSCGAFIDIGVESSLIDAELFIKNATKWFS